MDMGTETASYEGVCILGSHIAILIPSLWQTVSRPQKNQQGDIPHDSRVGWQENNEQEEEVNLVTARGVI